MDFKNIITLMSVILVINACDPPSEIDKKRTELKKKKTELNEIRAEITALENEISSMDPEFAKANRKSTLVSVIEVEKKDFSSFVEISGSIESRKNVDISAETIGTVQKINVDEGQYVKQGQFLVQLENNILRKNLAELQTSYELATTMFERQSNLWEQKIGTEVQYLEAKNRKESLENQMETLKSQIDKTYIRAPFSGTVDVLEAKIGMLAQPGIPMIRLVSMDNMYIKADISESYIGAFEKGQRTLVTLPSLNLEFESEIVSLGQVINQDNRTFSIEVSVPDLNVRLKTNLIAIVRIKDYEIEDAPVIPTNLIQKDGDGNFVYVVSSEGDVQTAKKVTVKRGRTYQNRTVVLEGLMGGEILIDEGFRDVGDGVNIKIVEGTAI
ncbi:MAG: efflux RND transporter periplasmic adaptor subunit [Cyclobacteriaceae bacterium]|nr:efflux RND transporter periplasmic adaptor subunit [Cyclobacteriaceae bacterium]